MLSTVTKAVSPVPLVSAIWTVLFAGSSMSRAVHPDWPGESSISFPETSSRTLTHSLVSEAATSSIACVSLGRKTANGAGSEPSRTLWSDHATRAPGCSVPPVVSSAELSFAMTRPFSTASNSASSGRGRGTVLPSAFTRDIWLVQKLGLRLTKRQRVSPSSTEKPEALISACSPSAIWRAVEKSVPRSQSLTRRG